MATMTTGVRMKMSRYMPPSKSDTHLTPDKVWDIIKDEWGYSKEDMFDPCPAGSIWDGLQIEWQKLNYVNPPYSTLAEWVYKAINERNEWGRATVMLLPTKTDQLWFHDLLTEDPEIVWIKGRLKFKNNKWGAPQPHFLVRIA